MTKWYGGIEVDGSSQQKLLRVMTGIVQMSIVKSAAEKFVQAMAVLRLT